MHHLKGAVAVLQFDSGRCRSSIKVGEHKVFLEVWPGVAFGEEPIATAGGGTDSRCCSRCYPTRVWNVVTEVHWALDHDADVRGDFDRHLLIDAESSRRSRPTLQWPDVDELGTHD